MNTNEFIGWVLNNTEFTLQEIADNVGFSRNNFYKWRDGETSPKKSTINKLVDYIGYDIKWDGNEVEIIGEKSEINFKEGEDKLGIQADTIIQNQQQLINSLNKEVNILRKKKSLKVSPACSFKSVGKIALNTSSSVDEYNNNGDIKEIEKYTTTGDVSMLGYTLKEYNQFSVKELIGLYHPESLREAMKVKDTMVDDGQQLLNIKGLRTLRGKKGVWVNFMVEYYFIKSDNGVYWDATIYYQHLNGKALS